MISCKSTRHRPSMIPQLLPSARFFPRHYRPGSLGHWSGHLPFACDLIAELKPSVIVELGCQYGESYFGFCQAVVENQVPSKAFAVDTWQGDRHTGAYGEEVFRRVSDTNERHYTGFSRLLRMTFDEAALLFQDETIDLLHIDGLHEYAAVRHDFDSWIAKVRPGGIVLLHDIAIRGGGFGVWELWDELSQAYPAFGFTHSCGLGVIRKPGGTCSSLLLRALFGDPVKQAGVRSYYELCADRLEARYQASLTRPDAVFESRIQLYWRGAGETFAEERSASLSRALDRNSVTVVFDLPAEACPVEQLRLDFAGEAAVFQFASIGLLDAESRLLWSADFGSFAAKVLQVGGEVNSFGETLLLRLTDPVCSMLLPIRPEILRQLNPRNRLELNMSAVTQSAALGLLMSRRPAELAVPK
jgi:hypothetical protein